MKFLTTYLVFFLAFTFNTSSFACSCLQQDLKDRFENYENIFSAKLNSATIVYEKGEEKWAQIEGDFQIIETFKGKLKQKIKLKSGLGMGDCGVPMIVGRKYIILNNGDSINICSGTNTIDMYFDDVLSKKYRQLSSKLKK